MAITAAWGTLCGDRCETVIFRLKTETRRADGGLDGEKKP